MNSTMSSGWCPVDARDVATARTVLSLAQQTFGNPATLVQKLLGLSADDYQEVVQSLSASGASYVDIVAAYLHNLRVLYDDCGGQFPPEIFSLSTQGATEQMVKDVCQSPASPNATGKMLPASQTHGLAAASRPSPAPRPKPSMSISVPITNTAKLGRGRMSMELSPRSTLAGPPSGYASSNSPTSPSSVLLSPRPAAPPALSAASAGWAASAATSPQAAALWQAQLQQAAQLNYQQLLAQSSLAQTAAPHPMGLSMPMPTAIPMPAAMNQMQFSTTEALLSAQAALNPTSALHPSLLLGQAPTSQQYVDALAATLQGSMLDARLQQPQQHSYPPAMPCAYTACLTGMEDPRSCSPTYGLNYDAIKRIWEAPGAGPASFHHVL